jgi:hypothetical protein
MRRCLRVLAPLAAAMLGPFVYAEPLSGKVALSEKLSSWKQELEATGVRIAVARIYVDKGAYVIPPDAEERALLTQFFSQYGFRAQFVLAHALNINVDQPRRVALVVLNMERLMSSRESEEAIVAHELGHIWLHQTGRRAPPVLPGALACEAIHSGDMVQHVLIRRELLRREIDFRPAWVADLETAYQQIAKQPPESAAPTELCARLQRLAQTVDTRLGLAPGDWANQEKYQQRLLAADPLLGEIVERLVRLLSALDLENRIDYYAGLGAVRSASTLLIQQLVEKAQPAVVP